MTAKRNLATIAEAISAPQLQGVRFVVEGHTDASGTAAYNESLSLRRAHSALVYVVSLGVPQNRLVATGRGEADLLPGVDPMAAQQRTIAWVSHVSPHVLIATEPVVDSTLHVRQLRR